MQQKSLTTELEIRPKRGRGIGLCAPHVYYLCVYNIIYILCGCLRGRTTRKRRRRRRRRRRRLYCDETRRNPTDVRDRLTHRRPRAPRKRRSIKFALSVVPAAAADTATAPRSSSTHSFATPPPPPLQYSSDRRRRPSSDVTTAAAVAKSKIARNLCPRWCVRCTLYTFTCVTRVPFGHVPGRLYI